MKLHDKVAQLRADLLRNGRNPVVPDKLQGITKNRIREVLARLKLGDNKDLIDGVFALLDDQMPSWFSTAPKGTKLCDGATTAHLACHIGILQRDNGKLDREGRDYWIKPLRELDAIEPVLLFKGEFIHGHVIAKSPLCCYRLADDFKDILRAEEGKWQEMLAQWSSEDAARKRREFQAQMAEASKKRVGNPHSDLITAATEYYTPKFLPGYEVIYVDDGDGDRITDEDKAELARAGVEIRLGDSMPDVLLWNPSTNQLWVIEAVTSDGEVDIHKVAQLKALAERCGKTAINFTTAYRNWKDAAARQSAHSNIAVDTYIWIEQDPAKHFLVESFK